ncbi:MAG: S24 family peptidase [Mariprofundaceae bacterium]|nr:S24 family peptidase [Mariprofundaceae bacterium]
MADREVAALAKLRDYYRKHQLIPSYAGLGDMLGLSKQGAVKLAGRLLLRGWLKRGPGGRLVPGGAFFERPLVGAAAAGFASPAEELMGDAITIDEYLVEHPSSTVLVEVRGDSMINAGIHDGDMLVVERCSSVNSGKIVVAIVDGDFTIKYLQRDRHGYYLQPANDQFSIIRPQGSLEIYGEVVGQFRKLR